MSAQDPIREVAAAPPLTPSEEHPEGTRSSLTRYRPKVSFIIGAGLFGAVVVGTILMSMGESTPNAQTAPAGAAQPLAAPLLAALPAAPPKVEGLSAREASGALRRDATLACKAGQWQRCKTDVEQAALLDPEGDKVPAVQRLHKAGEQGHF